MSDTAYEDDDQDPSNLVKDLRKQIKDLTKTNGELKTEVGALRAKTRSSDIAGLLPDGVNPKAARFFPADQEVTKETVASWLEENAELFPVQKPADVPAGDQPAGDGQSQVDPAAAAALTRLNQLGATGNTIPDVESVKQARLSELQAKQGEMSLDDYIAALRQVAVS